MRVLHVVLGIRLIMAFTYAQLLHILGAFAVGVVLRGEKGEHDKRAQVRGVKQSNTKESFCSLLRPRYQLR